MTAFYNVATQQMEYLHGVIFCIVLFPVCVSRKSDLLIHHFTDLSRVQTERNRKFTLMFYHLFFDLFDLFFDLFRFRSHFRTHTEVKAKMSFDA